jgi:hypothetical protein
LGGQSAFVGAEHDTWVTDAVVQLAEPAEVVAQPVMNEPGHFAPDTGQRPKCMVD